MWLPSSYGQVSQIEAQKSTEQAQRLAEAQRLLQIGKTGAKVGAALLKASGVFAGLAPPFSTIVAVIPAAVGAILTVTSFGKAYQARTLGGDPTVIRLFVKRLKRWDRAKRIRVADRLLRRYQRMQKWGDGYTWLGLGSKQRKDRKSFQARLIRTKLKLAAMAVVEIQLRQEQPSLPTPPVRVKSDKTKQIIGITVLSTATILAVALILRETE
tara:strand:+ start:1123 stop:1761 length:639 start_codon:yes stop_codon:yes gene_type:complete